MTKLNRFKEWREANGVERREWTLYKGDIDGVEVRSWVTDNGPVLEQVGPGDTHEVWVPAQTAASGGLTPVMWWAISSDGENKVDRTVEKVTREPLPCWICGVPLREASHLCIEHNSK